MIPTQHLDEIISQRSRELQAEAEARRAVRTRRPRHTRRVTHRAPRSRHVFQLLALRT